MSKEKSNPVRVLCDDARLQIAELLPELVRCLGEKALGKAKNGGDAEPSLPHIKSLIDLAEYLEVEKKGNIGKEAEAEEDPEGRFRSLAEILLEPEDEAEDEDEDD